MSPPDSSRTARKRSRSNHTSDDTEEIGWNEVKKDDAERATYRSDLRTIGPVTLRVNEELRLQRAREIGVGASSNVTTTDGAVRVDVSTTEGTEMVDVGTTDGDPSVDSAISEKSDPPGC
uniref:Integrase core domain containing protein n=1 Tax=Solanum tuberosum TaxID=4113 RepID=M1DH46_SOLTU